MVIDGGALLRSSSTSDFTQTTTTLAVEVTDSDTHPDGTDALRQALAGAGVKLIGLGGLDAEGCRARATFCWSRRAARRRTTSSATAWPGSDSVSYGWNSAATRSPRSSAARRRRRAPSRRRPRP
ncbi:hypothetical protein NKH18_26275 [Streptomyces sp. M10(2022)]